ncbi:MAG: hypothetical protein ACI90Z_002550, partial [Cyanobium sp.]
MTSSNGTTQLNRNQVNSNQVNSNQANGNQAGAKKAHLRVIPLGGLHEIGKNTCVFEYGDDIM